MPKLIRSLRFPVTKDLLVESAIRGNVADDEVVYIALRAVTVVQAGPTPSGDGVGNSV